MQAAEDNAATLREHMTRTYLNLRIGIAVIGAVLPVLLWGGGALTGQKTLLGSMSAYYHTPLRDLFVGALVTIGVFLYLYKGFSTKENRALNLGGAFAVGLAMIATAAPGGVPGVWSKLHDAFGVAFFLCIAYVSVFRAADTLSLLDDPQKVARLRAVYRALGIGMIVSPLTAVVLAYTLEPHSRGRSFVFFVEAVAVWMFAAYWLVKSRELSQNGAERLALAGRVEAPPALKGTEAAGRLVRVDAQ
jgi:hypothetical protein